MTSSGDGFINFHGTSIVVEDVGVFIRGASGSGKTSIALGLLDVAAARGLTAKLLADDQTLLASQHPQLLAKAPSSIEGVAEVTGFGIVTIPNTQQVSQHTISLIATLIDDHDIERMPKREIVKLLGCDLLHCNLPIKHESQAIRILLAVVDDWF